MNTALAHGKDLLITPGVYHLDQTLNVTRADTVVLGLGLATLVPDNGVTAMKVADVDGVKIAGLLFDAGRGEFARVDADRAIRLTGGPLREPDVLARRVLADRRGGPSARRRQPARQQQQRHH